MWQGYISLTRKFIFEKYNLSNTLLKFTPLMVFYYYFLEKLIKTAIFMDMNRYMYLMSKFNFVFILNLKLSFMILFQNKHDQIHNQRILSAD